MANLQGFNAHDVEPKKAFDPIPANRYLACITESEMKPTNSGNGRYLELRFQVLEGEHKGRLLWTRLNLENPKQQTVQIARAELSAICRAVGVMTPKDSVELHNLPLLVTVKVVKRKDTGEPQNRITKYEKREGAEVAPPQATTDSPPWRRT